MATQYAGCNEDDAIEDVTFGTSTTGKTVEITFDDTTGMTQDRLEDCVQKIMDAMNQKTFPAA